MKRSHLTRHLQREAKRTITMTIIGMVILIAVAIIYGPNFIIKLSTMTGKTNTSTNTTTNDETSVTYVAPPILDEMSNATNSAEISISGSSEPNARVFLSVNGKETGATTAHANRTFVFRSVTLQPGANEIKAKATTKDKDSEYSTPIKITYSNKAPSLSVDSPQDGQTFSKEQNPIKVSGKTEPNAKVTVNDFWATINEQGQYSYLLNLHDGDNPIKVVSTDEAGNKTQKELKVIFHQ